MSDNILVPSTSRKANFANGRFEIWFGRFITYFLILLFLVGCAYLETVLIPQAIESNRKIAEYEGVSSPGVAEVVATHESVRNSSWLLAFVCFAMIPPGFWALWLATKGRYSYCWIIIGLCLTIFLIAATLFKPV